MGRGALLSHLLHCSVKFVQRFAASSSQKGRLGGGIAYQDSLKHVLWRSILGFLPRTVLVGNTPSQASGEAEYIHQKPLAHGFAQSRVVHRATCVYQKPLTSAFAQSRGSEVPHSLGFPTDQK